MPSCGHGVPGVDRAPASVDAREPNPPSGYVVSFLAFHDQRLRVSSGRYMRALPNYYGVELHNFNPNSIT